MSASSSTKVALITGGASGMGLAVATALVERGDWNVHLIDRNEETGHAAVDKLGTAATFHQADVTQYDQLASTFEETYKKEGRLHMVWANAGIASLVDMYQQHPPGGPPPEPSTPEIDINLRAVFWTSYLALHYFRQSPSKDKNLLLTASSAGLYGGPRASATYTASKHGVIGLLRTLDSKYALEGIRVNAICPGPVRTSLLRKEAWDRMPQESFVEISLVVETVLQLIDGKQMVDANGSKLESGEIIGRAVELSGENIYFRDQIPYSDAKMAKIMGG